MSLNGFVAPLVRRRLRVAPVNDVCSMKTHILSEIQHSCMVMCRPDFGCADIPCSRVLFHGCDFEVSTHSLQGPRGPGVYCKALDLLAVFQDVADDLNVEPQDG